VDLVHPASADFGLTLERSHLSETDPRIRIILPPPRATKVEHEVASATGAGIGHERNGDAVSIFTLGVPSEDWNGVVLAVADAKGWSARGDVASAVAVEAFEDGLTGWTDDLEFTSSAWQEPVAQALASAFDHANAKVRSLAEGASPGQGVALTAAVLLGNWLCVAHAGDSRVYRLAKGELEQLTADHGRLRMGRNRTRTPAPGPLDDRPVRALGLAAHVSPSVRFHRVKVGEVVLACSDGLCRHLDGEDLAAQLGSRKPIEEVAKDLVATAAERGGEDDMSVCLARVGRLPAKPLPEPVGRPVAEIAAETSPLPRYRVRRASSPLGRRIAAVLGAVVLVGGAVGGFWVWWSSREPAPPVVISDTVRLQQSGSAVPTSPAPPAPVDTAATDTAVPPPAAPPATSPSPAAGEIIPGDSLEIIQRQIADMRERRRKDSVAAEQKQRDDQRVRDSLVAAQATAEAEQRTKDSLTMVARREAEAQKRREAAALAEQQERERREAQLQTQRDSADRAAKEREDRIAAGRNAVNGWLNSVVSNVNAGNVGAPVLVAGPPGFAAFVGKNKPKLSDAKVTGSNVTDQSADATAEWTAKWRGEFGTSTTRRMKATATLVPDGDIWRLRSWRITEGAP
jgi:protein phosphatase